jgi:hypothetical protein
VCFRALASVNHRLLGFGVVLSLLLWEHVGNCVEVDHELDQLVEVFLRHSVLQSVGATASIAWPVCLHSKPQVKLSIGPPRQLDRTCLYNAG